MLIFISGPAGSGKSTLANTLETRIPLEITEIKNVHRTALANPIKAMLGSLVTFYERQEPRVQWVNKNKEATPSIFGGKTIRYALQTLGTEWGRDLINEDIWVDAVKRTLFKASSTVNIIDDVRFVNEVVGLRDIDSQQTIHIHCPHVFKEEEGLDVNHGSEKETRLLAKDADFILGDVSTEERESIIKEILCLI